VFTGVLLAEISIFISVAFPDSARPYQSFPRQKNVNPGAAVLA
jgi:hypothetical protein